MSDTLHAPHSGSRDLDFAIDKLSKNISGMPDQDDVSARHGNSAVRQFFLITLIMGSIVGVFVLDVLTPLGFVVWMLYLLPLGLTSGFPEGRPSPRLLVAAASTGFIAAGFWLAPPGVSPWLAAANRTMGIAIIWLTAALLRRLIAQREVIRRNEEELRDFVEGASVGLRWVGLDGTILWANQAELNLLGYAPHEYLGHSIREFHVDLDIVEDLLRRMQRGETLHNYEGRLRCKDGSIRHVSIASNVSWRNGKFSHSRCFTRDITAQREAQRTQSYLAAIIHSSDDAIIAKNLQGIVTSWNRGAERLFGYTAEEMIGQSVLRLIPPDRHDEERFILEKIAAGESVQHYETVRRHKEGTAFYVSLTVSPVSDDQGRIIGASTICRDITQQKRADEVLRRSESFYRQTIESIPGMVFTNEPDGRCDYVSRQWVEFTGTLAPEQLGSGWIQVLHPEDRERAFAAWRAAVEGRGQYDLEYRVRRHDGVYNWFKVRGRAIRDETGAIVRWFGTALNIDDLKRVEQALRESEERWRLATEATAVGIWEWNVLTDQIRWDAHMFRIYQVAPTPDGIVPYSVWKDAVDPDDLPVQEQLLRDTVQRRGHGNRSFRIRRKNGECRHIDAVETVRPNEQGEVEWVVGTNIDVTARKLAEEALRASEEFTRTVLENSPDCVKIIDSEGRLQYMNSNGRCLMEIEDWEGFVNRLWWDLWGDEYRPRVEEAVRLALRGNTANFEAHCPTAKGTPKWWDVNVVAIPTPPGHNQRLVSVSRDITARKIAEAVLRERDRSLEEANAALTKQTAALIEANKELESFSYSVSHDLRAPLRSIDGFAKVLVEDFGPSFPDEARRCLNVIQNGAGRMGELIDDLLEFSRLSRSVLKMSPVDVNKIIQEVWHELRRPEDGRRVELTVAGLTQCRADRRLLKQVWMNLLSNALKYTRPREDARIEIGSRNDDQQPGQVVYWIRDNGVGFDQQYVHKLFGVFQRLHRKDEFEGTGVGLAIVSRIVHRHGGRVWAEGRLDQGATFYFTLKRI